MSTPISTEQEKYDDVLMQIAGQIGSVQGLLDKFFGFLHRKTDFYVQYTESSQNATMGFPVGVAEKMVLKCFKKYRMKDYKLDEGQQTSHQDNLHDKSAVELKSNELLPSCVNKVVPTRQGASGVNAVNIVPTGKQIPIGNGGVAENYYWTQTLDEVTVYIDAPKAMKGKDVNCTITSKFMTLSVDEKVLVEGQFEEAIRADESMWTLNLGGNTGSKREGSEVIVTLEKSRKTWWKHVIVGHPEIDTSKVDSSQRIDEYDDSTQAALRKVMFDQKQKALGLASSDDIAKDDLLNAALNARDSPLSK